MVTLGARLVALERMRGIGETWNVLAEAWGDGDEEAVYIVCGRWPGEASRQLTPAEYRRFAAEHSVMMLRLSCRSGPDDPGL